MALTQQRHVATRWPEPPSQDREHGGLARSVRPEKDPSLSFVDDEGLDTQQYSAVAHHRDVVEYCWRGHGTARSDINERRLTREGRTRLCQIQPTDLSVGPLLVAPVELLTDTQSRDSPAQSMDARATRGHAHRLQCHHHSR